MVESLLSRYPIPDTPDARIFVFGSNLAGKHMGGAARYAFERFGAEMGVGEGRTGQTYALPTLTGEFEQRSLFEIAASVKSFKDFAAASPDLTFYVTRVGCGIAGFIDDQIAPLFIGSPANCEFDPMWSSYGLKAWEEVM